MKEASTKGFRRPVQGLDGTYNNKKTSHTDFETQSRKKEQ